MQVTTICFNYKTSNNTLYNDCQRFKTFYRGLIRKANNKNKQVLLKTRQGKLKQAT